jgi:hypothetical protein
MNSARQIIRLQMCAASLLSAVLSAFAGCDGSPQGQVVVPVQHAVPQVPQVPQRGGNGFAEIQPGQSVTLTLSSAGMRLNDTPLPEDNFQSVLADLVSRGVLGSVPLTVIIEKDVRVLDRKAMLKRLEDQQLRYELLDDGRATYSRQRIQ